MATKTREQRAEIARRNGAKSRGPVTAEGKARASQNAVTHGLYTRNIVIENESPELYLDLRENYLREFAPVGDRETDLVLDIVNARWRLSRVVLMETAAIDCAMSRQRDALDEEFETADEAIRTSLAYTGYNGIPAPAMSLLVRVESSLLRNIERCTRLLKQFQTARRQSERDECAAAPAASSGASSRASSFAGEQVETPVAAAATLEAATPVQTSGPEKRKNEPTEAPSRPFLLQAGHSAGRNGQPYLPGAAWRVPGASLLASEETNPLESRMAAKRSYMSQSCSSLLQPTGSLDTLSP